LYVGEPTNGRVLLQLCPLEVVAVDKLRVSTKQATAGLARDQPAYNMVKKSEALKSLRHKARKGNSRRSFCGVS
jgi:hypothetical protein